MSNDAFRQRMLEATRQTKKQTHDLKGRIAKLYEEAAEDMARRAARARPGGLTEKNAWMLARSLKERSRELWADIGEMTKSGMVQNAQRMAGVQTSFIREAARLAELDLKPTLERVFASTADKAVESVMAGKIYSGPRMMLSKRIWNNEALYSGQIEELIAGAVAKKQSAIQLAKNLEAYLRPDVMMPDTWDDVYPDMPFNYKVDYNAKRLAVTSSRHTTLPFPCLKAREVYVS
ncbi:MAG: hypothetical protein ACOX6G_03430 [Christensenellales bacterium]|jgi:hypothetical protein